MTRSDFIEIIKQIPEDSIISIIINDANKLTIKKSLADFTNHNYVKCTSEDNNTYYLIYEAIKGIIKY